MAERFTTGANDPNPSGTRPKIHAVAIPPPRYSRTGQSTWTALCRARINTIYDGTTWGAVAAIHARGHVCRRCVELTTASGPALIGGPMPKQLIVQGHGLRAEGRVFRIGDRYSSSLSWAEKTSVGIARCSCGEESPSLPSTAARRRWHRAHKQAVRDALEDG